MKRREGEGEVGEGREVGIMCVIKRLKLDKETETSWQR